jgi:hypothetical protein
LYGWITPYVSSIGKESSNTTARRGLVFTEDYDESSLGIVL